MNSDNEESDDSRSVASSSSLEPDEPDHIRNEDPHYFDDDGMLQELGGVTLPISRQGWITGNARTLTHPVSINVKRQRRMSRKALHGADYLIQPGEFLLAERKPTGPDSSGLLPVRSTISGIPIPKNIPDSEVLNYFNAHYFVAGLAYQQHFGLNAQTSYLREGLSTALNTGEKEVFPGDIVCVYPDLRSGGPSGFPSEIAKEKPWLEKMHRRVLTTTPLQHMKDLGVSPDNVNGCLLQYLLELNPDMKMYPTAGQPELTPAQKVTVDRKLKHFVPNMPQKLRSELRRTYNEDGVVFVTRVGAFAKCTATTHALPGKPFYCILHETSRAVLSAVQKLKLDLAEYSQTN